MAEQVENQALKGELIGLFQYIKRVRQEIAAIQRGADEDHNFEGMGEQLDAIVKATEQATNSIMAAMEKNDRVIARLKEMIGDKEQTALLDQINENDQSVYEACSFQDITGQRVSKVVKSVTFVEDRVNSLIELWGKNEVEKEQVEREEKTADEKLLSGPQLEGKGLDQAAIDALFD
jgi:chemotaxis protein CheZ